MRKKEPSGTDDSQESRAGCLSMPNQALKYDDGKLSVLVVPVCPTDKVLTTKDETGKQVRKYIIDTWDKVRKYYGQVSYGGLDVSYKCLGWSPLSGDSKAYVTNQRDKNGSWVGVAPNIRCEADYATLSRLWSEAAQAAKRKKVSLDDYDILVCVINLNGNKVKDKKGVERKTPIRGFGDYSTERFLYKGAGLDIDIPVVPGQDLRLIVVDEQASWGRCAHEVGHCLIPDSFPIGSTFCEDLYPDNGVDSTAAGFDLMGHHDEAPLFSGYAMEQLGFYKGKGQIKEIDWRSRDEYVDMFEVAAHGLEPNTVKNRYNLLKIKIADGLDYYVEVRQRSRGEVVTDQVFDRCINLGERNFKLSEEANVGGVVVTQVVTVPAVKADRAVRTNQEMRYITLLHDQQRLTTEQFAEIKAQDLVDLRLPHVLKEGDYDEGEASDPLRGITIKALEPILDRPLTYKVCVQWNKKLLGISKGATNGGEPDPASRVDLWIKKDKATSETDEIWVESPPFGDGKWDYGKSGDKPMFGGDRPVAGVENRVWVRVRRKGGNDDDSVGVHLYSISPPGFIGSGTWSPINFFEGRVKRGGHRDFGPISWTPSVDDATSLVACIDPWYKERVYGDNWAQEVVFDMDSAYGDESAIPAPVSINMVLHNPLMEKAHVYVKSEDRPGFDVELPGESLPGGRKSEVVAVTIKPTKPYKWYLKKEDKDKKTISIKVPISCYVKDSQQKERCIGSASVWVSFKPRVDVSIRVNDKKSHGGALVVDGLVVPLPVEYTKDKKRDKIHVTLTRSDVNPGYIPPASVTIKKDGAFRAQFEDLAPGQYTAMAQLVYSRHVARTTSKEVDVKVYARKKPEWSIKN